VDVSVLKYSATAQFKCAFTNN